MDANLVSIRTITLAKVPLLINKCDDEKLKSGDLLEQ